MQAKRAVWKVVAGALCAAAFGAAPCVNAAPTYSTVGDCGGLPRLKLKTPQGWCVGLVAQGLRFARGIALLPSGDVVVAEMGGWMDNRGHVSILRKADHYARENIFDGLNEPHGVAIGPDHKVYVGVVGGVFRFDPAKPAMTREDVIGGKSGVAAIPGAGLHPLASLLFDPKGDLLVSLGSETDHCDAQKAVKVCAEEAAGHAVIRRYPMKWPEGKAGNFTVEAQGLRNSLAIGIHRASGTLWQAENSRDAINKADPKLHDDQLPHDEINRIVAGRHYGWPYCYDNNIASPEFPGYDCKSKTAPFLLLPPHAAPLAMAIDNDAKLPAPFTGDMLITLHGYRKTGHRLIAFRLDAKGEPTGNPIDLIDGWESAGAGQPTGTPVGLAIGPDGAIYISEDRNGTVLRLTRQ